MNKWGIRVAWRYEAAEIVKETAKCVFYIERGWRDSVETRAEKRKFLDWRGTEEAARKLCDQLTSAKAECARRERAARDWFSKRRDELLRDSGSGPEGGDGTAPGEAPQSGQSDSEGIAQTASPNSLKDTPSCPTT